MNRNDLTIELCAIRAYKEGKTLLDNPYPVGSEASQLWMETYLTYKDMQNVPMDSFSSEHRTVSNPD